MKLFYFKILAVTILVACGKVEHVNEIDYGKKIIDPVAIDSLVSAEYYLIPNDKEFFKFNNKAKSLLVYYYLDINQVEKDTMHLINYNKLNKITYIYYKDYSEKGNKKKFYYNDKGELELMIEEDKGVIDEIPYLSIRKYSYDSYGNLLSNYWYIIRSEKYEFKSYSEYKYNINPNNVEVEVSILNKTIDDKSFFKENKLLTYNKDGEIIKARKKGMSQILGNKYYDRITDYVYKTTSKDTYLYAIKNRLNGAVGEYNQIYEKDSLGRLILDNLQTKNIDVFKNEAKQIKYSKTDNKRKVIKTNEFVTTTNEINQSDLNENIKTTEIYKFDNYGNVVYEKIIDKKDENNHFLEMKSNYKLDKNNNWTNRTKYYTQIGDDKFSKITEENLFDYGLFREFDYIDSSTKFKEFELPKVDVAAEQLLLNILKEQKFHVD